MADEVYLPPSWGAPGESGAPRTEPIGFHQGVVVAWDAIAGTNTIRIHGADFVNLLSLLGSEGGLIRQGDVVALTRYQTTYAVWGRIDVPGVEQRALGIVSARDPAGVYSTSDTYEDLGGPWVDVYIGSSRRCKVDITALISAFDCIGFVGVEVSGASSIGPTEGRSLAAGWGAADAGTVHVGATRVVTLTAADGLNEGYNRFSLRYKTSLGVSGSAEYVERELVVQPF
ncbi:hypothetical protein [Actinokineospora spheciospongiae]|uniref:hypothetical protein n=1 Tax=Actinokineospora spheciospongiae TaxID=909613 RepID=UPI000D70C08C|nr:hypothetical protein [Actinokineospora spheciospongiae]PWW50271.1 hypothetical protein DFQ13_12333 [Actinokineospora spheciospongiae]